MVGLGRLELPTYGLGNRRSIHLSYSPDVIHVLRLSQRIVAFVFAMHKAGRVSQPGVCERALSSFHFSYVC